MLPEKNKIFIDFGLGSGYIADTAKGYFLQIQHSIKQKEYLQHKITKLQELGFNPSFKEEYRENSYSKYFVRSTCYTKYAKTAYKYLYNKKRKTLDKSLLSVCDRRSLAYWYMDEGCVDYYDKVRTGDKLYQYEIPFVRAYRLVTHTHSKEELDLVCEWFKEKYAIIARPTKVINFRKDQYNISITLQQSKDIFKSLIEDYIVESMNYKLKYPHSLKGIPYTLIVP